MSNTQRQMLPDNIHTNNATPNPWWSNAVVYQIYPRSFQDTNNDGIGDLPGITSRLDYLADLGVDVIWLSPVYRSPQDDNGYDIADYQDIDPLFGTLEDMDQLIAQAHARGIKIVMDLVVNHTSDEHAWFQASRDKNDEHADWYWWRPARPGMQPGQPGAEPNHWGSYFGGSAWTFDPQRGEYFFHQYSPKQPDLNWENPAVRQAVYAMMNWWMDRGIDGFRMDVITQISKRVDAEGRLPGQVGSQIEDYPVGADGYSSPFPFCSDGPRLDEFLSEMRREVFAGREGYLTVGEAPGVSAERSAHITDPALGELDMLFLFDHVDIDCEHGTKWNPIPLPLKRLKEVMRTQQESVAHAGWVSLFLNNHDQPRIVSRWGDDSTPMMRVRSAKALALLLHMHRGTPYVYQGEEIGMTNANFTRLEQYRDLESINMYRQRVEQTHLQSADSMMSALAQRSRDNSRTPMQWDTSEYAGFMNNNAGSRTDCDVRPWIDVNANYQDINVASQRYDAQSVFAFYQQLIALRHTNPLIAAADWCLVDENDERVYAFTRSLNDQTMLVLVNMTSDKAAIPAESCCLLDSSVASGAVMPYERIVIANDTVERVRELLASRTLDPWSALAIMI